MLFCFRMDGDVECPVFPFCENATMTRDFTKHCMHWKSLLSPTERFCLRHDAAVRPRDLPRRGFKFKRVPCNALAKDRNVQLPAVLHEPSRETDR